MFELVEFPREMVALVGYYGTENTLYPQNHVTTTNAANQRTGKASTGTPLSNLRRIRMHSVPE